MTKDFVGNMVTSFLIVPGMKPVLAKLIRRGTHYVDVNWTTVANAFLSRLSRLITLRKAGIVIETIRQFDSRSRFFGRSLADTGKIAARVLYQY
jgi:hypothetical protein